MGNLGRACRLLVSIPAVLTFPGMTRVEARVVALWTLVEAKSIAGTLNEPPEKLQFVPPPSLAKDAAIFSRGK